MLYPEFGQYLSIKDEKNSLVNGYTTPEGHIFYVEPGFYDLLVGLKSKDWEHFPKVMAQIDKIVKANPRVIFTVNFEQPFFQKDNFIYLEINDVTDPINVYFEDKCRGSDYGD
jgi:hypothetical protein